MLDSLLQIESFAIIQFFKGQRINIAEENFVVLKLDNANDRQRNSKHAPNRFGELPMRRHHAPAEDGAKSADFGAIGNFLTADGVLEIARHRFGDAIDMAVSFDNAVPRHEGVDGIDNHGRLKMSVGDIPLRNRYVVESGFFQHERSDVGIEGFFAGRVDNHAVGFEIQRSVIAGLEVVVISGEIDDAIFVAQAR